MLIIAHRLHTVADADLIIEMNSGEAQMRLSLNDVDAQSSSELEA